MKLTWVMRVRDRNGGNAAETLHDLDRGGIDEWDAVPQDVARGRAQQQRALADGKFRHRADADQAGLVLPVAIEMPVRERIERGPPLAAGRDELTLVLADRTRRRRLIRRRELAAAGLAEEGRHGVRRLGFGPKTLSRSASFDAMPSRPCRHVLTPRSRCELSTARSRW